MGFPVSPLSPKYPRVFYGGVCLVPRPLRLRGDGRSRYSGRCILELREFQAAGFRQEQDAQDHQQVGGCGKDRDGDS
jgi:hypothetical protein